MSETPLEILVRRGSQVESRHRVHAVVTDVHGKLLELRGQADLAVFPRSAVKPFQAVPLVRSGGFDASGMPEAALALACASHQGEPRHVTVAGAWLSRLGLDERALACGPHAPSNDAAARLLWRSGEEPTRLHNNCSGKHCGFLSLARALGASCKGYQTPEHPVQREVVGALYRFTNADPDRAPSGIDGCGVPTWALPLHGLALAFARLGAAQAGTVPDVGSADTEAAKRIGRAMAADPFLVAGTGAFATRLMEAGSGSMPAILTKGGAEGVYCAALPGLGLGIAVKAEDGAGRAASSAIASLLLRHGGAILPESVLQVLDSEALQPLLNTVGARVGEVEPA